MNFRRMVSILAGCCIIALSSGCGGSAEFDAALADQSVDSISQADWSTYVAVKVTPDNDLGIYVNGTKLTITWNLVGPAHAGPFTLELDGRVLATSLHPDSMTWTVPSLDKARQYVFTAKLWDGEVGKSPSRSSYATITAQPNPWTTGNLSVFAPASGERIRSGSVYRVKWDFIKGPWHTTPTDYGAYLYVWDGTKFRYQPLAHARMVDLATLTMYYDMKMPSVTGSTPAYIQFLSWEYGAVALRDETKRFFFIE